MKRTISFLTVLTLLGVLFLPLSSVRAAGVFTDSLITGESLQVGVYTNLFLSSTSTTSLVSDEDTTTKLTMGTRSTNTSGVWYTFDSPKTITAFLLDFDKLSGSASDYLRIVTKQADGTTRYITLQANPNSSAKTQLSSNLPYYSGGKIENVVSVGLENSTTTASFDIFEFHVWGEDYTFPYENRVYASNYKSDSRQTIYNNMTTPQIFGTANTPSSIFALNKGQQYWQFRTTMTDFELYLGGDHNGSPYTVEVDGVQRFSGNLLNAGNATVRYKISGLTSENHTVRVYHNVPNGGNGYVFIYWIDFKNEVDRTAPTVPANLRATNISDSSVTLTWEPSTDNIAVTRYNVYLNGVLNTTSTTTTVTRPTVNNQSNVWTVSAIDAMSNESDRSVGVTTLFDTLPPSTPVGITADNVGLGVRVSWSSSVESDIRSYNVYREGVFLANVTHPSTSYMVTGLVVGSSPSFQVSAVDQSGNESSRTAPISILVTEPTERYLSVGVNNVGSGQIVKNYGSARTVDVVSVLPYYYGTLAGMSI